MDRKADTTSIDRGHIARWGATSEDYRDFRPDPPASFYDRLAALDIGKSGQKILDVGTGTGALALEFARRGLSVVGTDIDDAQIIAAKQRAAAERLKVDFYVSPAERSNEPEHSVDVLTANQCWPYFDKYEMRNELKRVLRHDGLLVVSNFTYLPRLSTIAAASEKLVAFYNPDWTGINWDGYVAPSYAWAEGSYTQIGMFQYDECTTFTQRSWRGRMRALRGMSASLPADIVADFDERHCALLFETAPETFYIPHRISAHILKPL